MLKSAHQCVKCRRHHRIVARAVMKPRGEACQIKSRYGRIFQLSIKVSASINHMTALRGEENGSDDFDILDIGVLSLALLSEIFESRMAIARVLTP